MYSDVCDDIFVVRFAGRVGGSDWLSASVLHCGWVVGERVIVVRRERGGNC
jgi:hypothetical protein